MTTMNTPTRSALRRPDAPRRRSARQALAVIPDTTSATMSPEDVLSVDVNALDNLANSRYAVDSWSPAPSPDELVIQKRGRRRRTIIWSPDIDTCKRDSLLSLSSRDCTPVKRSPTKSSMVLRSTPRKRLMLGDANESPQLSTPEKQKRSAPDSQRSLGIGSPQKRFGGNLINGLRGLSHEQLVKMIVDLVSMQEDGLLSNEEKLRDVILKKMPVADIQPMRERLSCLRQNVYASLMSSDMDESAYNRAYIHLDAFQKTMINQGTRLLESQHWTAVMQYVFTAWNITKDLPEWENRGFENTTCKCFEALTRFCTYALKNGTFVPSTLDAYAKKLEAMATDCEDIKVCLQLIKEARTSAEK